MPHQFTPHAFVLERLSTDVRGSDFALLTLGPAVEALDNPVFNAPEVFAQRHMVHCSALGLACDNSELSARLAIPVGGAAGAGACNAELRLVAERWPPPQEDELLADLDSDVLQAMQPAARQDELRPPLAWLTAVPDDADATGLGDNLRGFLAQQLAAAAGALPAAAGAALVAFAGGEEPAGVLRALAHPSWPHDGQLAFELAATHAAAAAEASPPFCGDAPGGPLQLEVLLGEVVLRYAAARGCPPAQVQLAVLGTRQFRELRQAILVMCVEGDAGLGTVFGQPLQAVQEYNQYVAVGGGGEVVAQPDSDGQGLTWWLQSSIASVPLDQELAQPWKTWLNVDPTAPKGAGTQQALTIAAHSLGNNKYDELAVALFLPEPGAELRLPLRRARLRRGAALRPTRAGCEPRGEAERAPSAAAVATLVAAGVPLLAAPELVRWLRAAEGQDLEAVLAAIEAAGGISRGSPHKSPHWAS